MIEECNHSRYLLCEDCKVENWLELERRRKEEKEEWKEEKEE